MPIPTSVMRANLKALSPMLKKRTLQNARALQDSLGELMSFMRRNDVDAGNALDLGGFQAALISPRLHPRRGVILHLHGGGYCAGGLAYSMSFGGELAVATRLRVMCAAYRLAPENPFPAAIDDAYAAYSYMLSIGLRPEDIILCGESAGGGLALCLALKLKQLGEKMPAGIIAISPWTDLTLSGRSIAANAENDPSLSLPMIEYYAGAYAGGDTKNPLVSPLLGDLAGLPPCMMFAGSHELILSDTLRMDEALKSAGVDVTTHIEPEMWHSYVLYGVEESKTAMTAISGFIGELIHE